MQTTPKQELDYLAGLAVPVAPYITSGYFLGTGIGDMEENGVGVGNTIQVGLSTLPFIKPISNAAGKLATLAKARKYFNALKTSKLSPTEYQ